MGQARARGTYEERKYVAVQKQKKVIIDEAMAGDELVGRKHFGMLNSFVGWTMMGLLEDENGRPIGRTPVSNPYNFESYVVWKSDKYEKGKDSAIYTDRLLQWDFKKHDELCMKHFGNRAQHWDDREPEKVEAFLRDWCEDPKLTLTMVMKGCNQASGFPLWILFYKGGKE